MKQLLNKILPHAAAFFTVFIWSTTFITSKILLDTYSVTQLLVLRFAMAYIFLLLISLACGSYRCKKFFSFSFRDELYFFLLGIFGASLFYTLGNTALIYTTASNVSIINSSAPIIALFLSVIFLKNRCISKYTYIGSAICLSGVVLVVFNGSVQISFHGAGDVTALLAAFSWAIYSILLTMNTEKYSLLLTARKLLFYALITSLAVLFLHKENFFSLHPLLNPYLFFCLCTLGLLASGFCYITWSYASKRLSMITANNYLYLGPFITILTARAVLHEPLSFMAFAGSLLILLGILITKIKKCPSKKLFSFFKIRR